MSIFSGVCQTPFLDSSGYTISNEKYHFNKGTFPLDSTNLDVILSLEAIRYTAPNYCLQMSDGTNHRDIGWVGFFPDYDAIVDAQNNGMTGVRKIYDQSGNRNDAIQLDFSKMPTLIWEATHANRPAIHFDGDTSPQYLDITSSNLYKLFNGGGYIAHTSRVLGGGTTAFGVLWSNSGDSFGYRNTTQIRFVADFTTTDLFWTSTSVLNTWYTWEFMYNPNSPTTGQVYRDGITNGSISTSPVGSYTSKNTQLRVGASSSGSAGIEMDLTTFIAAKDIPI